MRWGICSAGRISHDFCNAMTAVSDNNKAVAIAARSLDRAQDFAKMFGIQRAYGSYEELANDAEIDIVYVGTIHPKHKATVSLFLNKGKHVLCEKSMTMKVKDTQELVSLAREKKLFLMEGFWSRCFPIYTRLRELVDSGAIGAVQTVEVIFEVPIGVKEKAVGGSSLLDIGCYTLQFSQWILREKHERLEVSGELLETGADKSGKIELFYPGGKRAILTFNSDLDGKTCASVVGNKGRLEIQRGFWSPSELILPNGDIERHPLPTGCLTEFNFPNSEGFSYEIEHIRQCIEKGLTESPLMPLDESLHIISIIEECYSKLGVSFD